MSDRKRPSPHSDSSGPAADILSSVNVGIYLVQKNKIVHVNPAYVRLTGYSAEELLGTNPLQYVHPEDRLLLEEAAQSILNDEHQGPLDIRIAAKNGNAVRVLAHTHPFLHKTRKAVLVSLTDITGQHQGKESANGLENRYRSIFEDLQEVYFETDLHGNIIFSNNALSAHLGYTREELIGMNNRQYTDEESSKRVYEAFHQLYRTGKPVKTVEETIIRKDGTRGTAELSAALIRDPSGQPIGFAGISREITERKQMEEKIRQSEERYRSILENMQEAYYENDLQGRFTFVNDRFCKDVGRTKEEVIGTKFSPYLDETDSKKTFQVYHELFKTGKPVSAYEIEVVRTDGKKEIYEISVDLTRDDQGKPTGFRSISRDITERKKMENELQQSEERYRTIINEMDEWFYETDLKGNLLFYNEALARELGYPPDALHGMNFSDIIEPQQADAVYALFHQVFVTGQPHRNVPYRFVRPDGSVTHAEFSIFAKCDHHGRIIGFRSVGHDITEKLKAQQQQLLSEKMASIGQLAAGAAAEINNPIFYVNSNLKTISEYLNDVVETIRLMKTLPESITGKNSTEGDALNNILTEIKRLEKKTKIDFILEDLDSLIRESQESVEKIIQIIRDLATYGHQGNEQPQPGNINDILETALNRTWNELKYKASIVKAYGELPNINCYPRQLHQVFINLLTNAAHAIEDEGEISLTTRLDPKGHIEIRIQDTGCGIPEENISKIFNPFFTTKKDGKRTGLGLHVAFSIIDRHQGKIEVESKVGTGTVAIITLPSS